MSKQLRTRTFVRPEEIVRQNTLKSLHGLGWREEQIQWKREWPVPDTPHDLTKRERAQKYASCGSCDIVLFDDDSVVYDNYPVHSRPGNVYLVVQEICSKKG